MDERDPSGRFVRGLTLGALLGAIIAGSSMWRRSKATRPTTRTTAPTGPAPRPADPDRGTGAGAVPDEDPRA